MKRGIAIFILVLLFAIGCTPQEVAEPLPVDEPGVEGMEEPIEEPAAMMELTLEELAAYNGENGMPAYVAVDGEIYDVTDHPEWITGEHGGNMAGTDITEMLNAAPHGIAKLGEVQKVGMLKMEVEGESGATAAGLQLTLKELEAYNGMDGMPAYVAVDGEIFDVTDHPQWSTGEHGGNLAGTDISEMLKAAPHGMGKLDEVMWVGILVDDMGQPVAADVPVGTHERGDDEDEDEDEEIELTLAELAAYNGMNGMPAYVAVDGKIYDVTNHPQWTTGEHGGNLAGTAISEMLKAAPHGLGKLDEIPEIGELED